jgi:hypothetical protein
MRKTKAILIFLLIVLTYSCTKNLWISDHAVRPKKPKFSILKQVFIGNNLIDTSYLYISTSKFPNFDGRKSIGYMGFYNNGKMIVDNTWENEMSSTVTTRNSWETAAAIGYYTSRDNNIKVQYFVSFDAGTYLMRKGVIKKDTVILEETTYRRLKKEIEYDTLVRSPFRIAKK